MIAEKRNLFFFFLFSQTDEPQNLMHARDKTMLMI